MYAVYAVVVAVVLLALFLIHYKPASVELEGVEGFAVAAVHPTLVPACVQRSDKGQALLARIADRDATDAEAEELRLIVSKLCCLDADIATPAAGQYRTQSLQFRTSHDMDVPSTFVGRCLRNAVRQRDIDLMVEKYQTRGHALIGSLLSGCADARAEFDAVVARTRLTMMNFCLGNQPQMDRPLGVRDMGFWDPAESADLMQYGGISAEPK